MGRAGAAVGRGWKKRGRTLSHFMYGVGSGGTELFAPPPVPPFTRMASVKVRKSGWHLESWKRSFGPVVAHLLAQFGIETFNRV